jgi:hypothetical protein
MPGLVRRPDPDGYTRVFRSSSGATQIESLLSGSARRDEPNGTRRPDPRWMWEGGAAAVAAGKRGADRHSEGPAGTVGPVL